MAIPSEYLDILVSLLQRTQQRQVGWEEGPTEYLFFTHFPNYTLGVEDTSQGEGTEFTISLMNEEGRVIDSFKVSHTFDPEYGEYFTDQRFGDVEELWRLARQNALNVADALREMRSALLSTAETNDAADSS